MEEQKLEGKDKVRFESLTREKDGVTFYVARCRPMGLTAYSDTREEAKERLKKMFGMLVDAGFDRLNS